MCGLTSCQKIYRDLTLLGGGMSLRVCPIGGYFGILSYLALEAQVLGSPTLAAFPYVKGQPKRGTHCQFQTPADVRCAWPDCADVPVSNIIELLRCAQNTAPGYPTADIAGRSPEHMFQGPVLCLSREGWPSANQIPKLSLVNQSSREARLALLDGCLQHQGATRFSMTLQSGAHWG